VIEPLVVGEGSPTTLFVGGMAQDHADVRVFGSGVAGTRVFQPLGHTTVADVGPALLTLAVQHHVDQLLGVSLGSRVLLALLASGRLRGQRCVIALPPVAVGERDPAARAVIDNLADALRSRDQTHITNALLRLQPAPVRDRLTVKVWARRQADVVSRMDLLPLLDGLDAAPPLTESDVRGIDVPILVLAQADDDAHPVAAAEQLAHLLPDGRLVVSDVAWVWGAREQLREVVSSFLAGGR